MEQSPQPGPDQEDQLTSAAPAPDAEAQQMTSGTASQDAPGAAARRGRDPDGGPQEDPGEPLELQAYWNQGLRFQTADRRFRLRLGGRIHVDFSTMNGTGELGSTFSTDPPGIIEDGAEIRRARFYMSGDVYDNFLYRIEYDFSNDQARAISVYVGWGESPIGELRAGFQKEPLSLERMMSSNDTTFIERGLPVDLASFRSFGIENIDQLFDERMYWSLGLFGESQAIEGDSVGEGNYAVTGRITGLPIYEDEGRTLFHLGAGGSLRNPKDEPGDLKQRPETHLAPQLLDTGMVTSEKVAIYALEAAAVLGPFSVQGEYLESHTENVAMPDSRLYGYYGYVSYFLTGEHRPYRTDYGRFTRVQPLNNFDGIGGSGAIELALRYSTLSFEDVANPDQTLRDWTFGINWYLNPNSRIMLNYVDGELDTLSGAFRALTIRFQVAF